LPNLEIVSGLSSTANKSSQMFCTRHSPSCSYSWLNMTRQCIIIAQHWS